MSATVVDGSQPEESPAAPAPGTARLPVKLGGWVWLGAFSTLVLAGVVGMSEVGRLIEGITTDQGVQASANVVFGPVHGGSDLQDAISVWASLAFDSSSSGAPSFWWLWIAHLGFDVVFIAGYVGLLLLLLPDFPGWRHGSWGRWRIPTTTPWPGYFCLRRMVLVMAAADMLEDLVSLVLIPPAVTSGHLGTFAAWVMTVVTWAKWATVAIVAVGFIYALRTQLRKRLGWVWGSCLTAIKWHRYSVVALVVLLVLMTGPGAGVLDQFPDVQRSWFDSPSALLGRGGVSAVVVVALSIGLLGLGRLRTEQYRLVPTDKTRTSPWVYAVSAAAGALLLLLFAASRAINAIEVNAARVWIASVVLLGVPGVSWFMRTRWTERTTKLRKPPEVTAAKVRFVGRFGDALAVAIVAVAFVGPVRALTAPWLTNRQGVQGAIAAACVVAAFGVWPAIGWWERRFGLGALGGGDSWYRPESDPGRADVTATPRSLPDTEKVPALPPMGAVLVLVVFGTASAGIYVLPIQVSAVLGVVGTAVLSLGTLVLAVGSVAGGLQPQKPMEVFRVMGLRAAPLLTFFLGIGLVGVAFSPQDDQHRIRTTATPPAQPGAATLKDAFTSWLASSGSCDVTANGERVRPLVLVAASGGGIRAAQWTVRSLARLSGTRCGLASVFLSSGVSGGSVGLELVANHAQTGNPDLLVGANAPDTAISAVEGLAGQDALSAGIAGLMLRDLVAGLTGVNVQPARAVESSWPATQPSDRAALMETVWEQEVPALTSPFGSVDQVSRIGQVVLNSASAAGHCRILVTTLLLPRSEPGQPRITGSPPACDDPVVSSSYRLTTGACLPTIDSSTAAMLSARFPYVTPSGVVRISGSDVGDTTATTCPMAARPRAADKDPAAPDPAATQDQSTKQDSATDQLIDGGYAESTGIGTLIDLAPELMALIRSHNEHPGSDGIVVPYVMFLENGYGSDVTTTPSSGVSEPQVPIVGRGAAAALASTQALLQRATTAYGDYLPQPGTRVGDLGGVVVISPSSKPRVEAPLGWVMATTTQQDLALANTDAFQQTSSTGPRSVSGLLSLLNGDS